MGTPSRIVYRNGGRFFGVVKSSAWPSAAAAVYEHTDPPIPGCHCHCPCQCRCVTVCDIAPCTLAMALHHHHVYFSCWDSHSVTTASPAVAASHSLLKHADMPHHTWSAYQMQRVNVHMHVALQGLVRIMHAVSNESDAVPISNGDITII